MPVDVLIENDTYVSQVRLAISDGGASLSDVPALLKIVLQEERWKSRRIKTGQEVAFNRFEDFVRARPLEGLGTSMDLIKRLCADDPESLDLLDRATKGKQGERTDLFNNVQEVVAAPTGNTKEAAIRRLRDQRPDLHARVLSRELSPHAAMIEAGFRMKTITIPDDPEHAARLIAKHFRGERLVAIIRELESHQDD